MRALVLAALLASVSPQCVQASVASRDPSAVPAGDYVLDPEHASVIVRVSHMGFARYTLRFDKVQGGFVWDPSDPDKAKAHVEIEARSLDAGPNGLGKGFADSFLKADEDPKIVFDSTGLTRNADGTGVLTGNLTLRGVTKPFELKVVFNGVGPGLLGVGHRVGFSATGAIRRSEFGSREYLPTLVGDEVDVEIEVEFYRK